MTLSAPDPVAELEELKSYLGPRYDHAKLQRSQRAVEEELASVRSEGELYRSSEAYLYDLTVFAMSKTKEPYLATIAKHVPIGARVLDYGCGIGSDGLRLLDAGYRVAFADFDNPSVEYLRWRLKRRGLTAEIFDLDRRAIPSDFDLAYAFDVIEHVDEPFDFLSTMERLAGCVLVNFLEPDPDETSLHRTLPVHRLVRHAATRRLVHYGVYHGRSHLVLYESASAGAIARLRSTFRIAHGRIARRR
jgi:SAM-dependent methyltransferase